MPSRSISARSRSASRRRPRSSRHRGDLNNLASLYQARGTHCRCLAAGGADDCGRPRAARASRLPCCSTRSRSGRCQPTRRFDEALDVIQHGTQSSAASAVNKLAVRARRRQRSSRRAGAAGSGSRERSGAARQGDHRRALQAGGARRRRRQRPAASGSPPSRPSAPPCKRPLPPNSPIMPRCRIRCR